MLRLHAEHFAVAFSNFGQLVMEVRCGATEPSERSLEIIGRDLANLLRHCEEMGLALSAAHIKRIPSSDVISDFPNLCKALEEVQQRISDEFSARTYLQLPTALAKYYRPSVPPFGQKVFDQFPSARSDVLEAGTCLALERNTAAVFHIMRVMELALKALAAELGIAYASGWGAYLNQITKIVDSDWKSKTLAEREKQPFYKQAAGDLQSMKIAWRNPTVHVERTYEADEAEQIYLSAKQFMNRLADAGLAE